MSQVTSHVLDTSSGRPATGIKVILYQLNTDTWHEIGRSGTNSDGRVTDLLANDVILPAGHYKINFLTKEYFDVSGTKTFYPFIEIVFDVTGPEHYHVPLLLGAYGYSTYRGS